MNGNVLSWKQALEKGCEPRLYSYAQQDLPEGEHRAYLDFKIWAKKVMAISLYFTILETGKKIQLTVFCKEVGSYRLEGCPLNFVTCPVKELYRIQIQANQKKKMVLVGADLLS